MSFGLKIIWSTQAFYFYSSLPKAFLKEISRKSKKKKKKKKKKKNGIIRIPKDIRVIDDWLIVLGFNDTSTLVGHFVSSPREGEKREKR